MTTPDLTATTRTILRILDPKLTDQPFTGTRDDATTALLNWAEAWRTRLGTDDATIEQLAATLCRLQHDRVADAFAALLLHHNNQMDLIAGDTGLW